MASDLHPPCEPRLARRLEVGGGHGLWVEECGPEDGLPVLFLHGGPGSGCSPAQRRLFDPSRFRAVLVDQRGAGRSLPLGGIEANTTDHLVADLETVRRELEIERWIVFGGSWGSLLGLRYAQAHPDSVLGLVLRGIFLGSRAEIDAYVSGAAAAFPAAWAPFGTPETSPGQRFAAFAQAVLDGDGLPLRVWLDYERGLMGEAPLADPPSDAQIAKARIQMHYLLADCFVEDGALLAGIERIRHLPAAIVQGMADSVCPPETALALHAAWPEAAWIPIPGGGHSGLAEDIAAASMEALNAVATSCRR